MATSKAKNNISEEVLATYDKLLSGLPGVERKGASMPYTSLNGNMFSFIDKDGQLSLRLPEKERNAFIEQYKSSLSLQHGVVMKEYVAVPAKLFEDVKALKPWISLSYAYAKALKTRSVKRK